MHIFHFERTSLRIIAMFRRRTILKIWSIPISWRKPWIILLSTSTSPISNNLLFLRTFVYISRCIHMRAHRVSMCPSLIRLVCFALSPIILHHSFFFRFLISSLFTSGSLHDDSLLQEEFILIVSMTKNETRHYSKRSFHHSTHHTRLHATHSTDRPTDRPLVSALKRVHFSFPELIETYHR